MQIVRREGDGKGRAGKDGDVRPVAGRAVDDSAKQATDLILVLLRIVT